MAKQIPTREAVRAETPKTYYAKRLISPKRLFGASLLPDAITDICSVGRKNSDNAATVKTKNNITRALSLRVVCLINGFFKKIDSCLSLRQNTPFVFDIIKPRGVFYV